MPNVQCQMPNGMARVSVEFLFLLCKVTSEVMFSDMTISFFFFFFFFFF